jgi:flagellar biosynthesis regulator FlaF
MTRQAMQAPPAAAMRAYAQTQSVRPQREQEAEVFAILAGRLRGALADGGDMARIRAVADARRVFSVVRTLVVHPSSELPTQLRGAIASVVTAALREADGAAPDLDFLAGIAEDFAAGLAARPQADR